MYDQIKAFNKTARLYGASMDRWVETGIWMAPLIDKKHPTGSLLPVGELAKKVRECAARRNMPFIEAEIVQPLYGGIAVVRMDMPKQNRTLKLAAPLIVICEQVYAVPGVAQIQQSPKMLMMAAEYRFFFVHDQFQKLILGEMTNTKEWRAAMRLPNKVIGAVP